MTATQERNETFEVIDDHLVRKVVPRRGGRLGCTGGGGGGAGGRMRILMGLVGPASGGVVLVDAASGLGALGGAASGCRTDRTGLVLLLGLDTSGAAVTVALHDGSASSPAAPSPTPVGTPSSSHPRSRRSSPTPTPSAPTSRGSPSGSVRGRSRGCGPASSPPGCSGSRCRSPCTASARTTRSPCRSSPTTPPASGRANASRSPPCALITSSSSMSSRVRRRVCGAHTT